MENDDYLTRVMNYGLDRGVGVQTTSELSPYTPCGSNPATHMIVINRNWHIHRQVPYQAAHEIAHVLHEDPGVVYFHVPTAKSGIEAEANRTAINILAPMYFDEIEPEDANIDEFLGAFAIPSYMYDVTYNAVRKFYENC